MTNDATPSDVVRRFCAAWGTGDVDAVVAWRDYFDMNQFLSQMPQA